MMNEDASGRPGPAGKAKDSRKAREHPVMTVPDRPAMKNPKPGAPIQNTVKSISSLGLLKEALFRRRRKSRPANLRGSDKPFLILK
jgi:hypothetical protein